jgi:hypothetical protein
MMKMMEMMLRMLKGKVSRNWSVLKTAGHSEKPKVPFHYYQLCSNGKKVQPFGTNKC